MSDELQRSFDDAVMLQTKKKWQQAISLFDAVILRVGASKNIVQMSRLEKSVCLHALKNGKRQLIILVILMLEMDLK